MMNKLKLNILALGNQTMLHRLSCRLDGEEVFLTGCSDTVEATKILDRESFDIVIIDNLMNDLESVCRSTVCAARAPIALMLQEKTANWEKNQNLTVDGFLPDEASNRELMARIKAYSRRKLAMKLINLSCT